MMYIHKQVEGRTYTIRGNYSIVSLLYTETFLKELRAEEERKIKALGSILKLFFYLKTTI